MNSSKILIVCVCCAIAGVALGFGLGRMGAGGKTAADMRKAKAIRAGDAQQLQTARKSSDDRYPDIADLKTPEQWRGYIERWLATGFPSNKRLIIGECLRRWSEVDAEGALAFVHGAKKFPDRRLAYVVPLAAIGAKNISRVIEWLRADLSKDDGWYVGKATITALREDGHAREAWALAQADIVAVDSRVLGQIMDAMSPAEALRAFNSMPDDEKDVVAKDFAAVWAKKDWNAALDWCAAQKGKDFAEDAAVGLLTYLAGEKPSEVVAAAQRMGVTFDSGLLDGVWRSLAENDPLVALEILRKMPPQDARWRGDEVVHGLFKTDPDQAIAAAQVLLPEGQREKAIYQSYDDWLRSDRRAAEEWLAKEADAGVREQIKMRQLAENDSLAFLASLGPGADLSGAFMSESLETALRDLAVARNQPDEALRWLLANPDQITDERLSRMAYNNSKNKAVVTAAGIERLPEDSKARESLITFATNTSLNRQEWGAAEDLLPLIDDAAKQDALRYRIFSSMMSKPSEQEAARAWLATQPLSDEVRASWEALAGAGAKAGGDSADDVVELIPFYVD